MSDLFSNQDERFSRQIRFAPIGRAGQEKLARSRVTIMGCGALGAAIAEQVVRAGVGHVRLIDRDFIEHSNLQRQALFTEADVQAGLPKVIAAAQHLRRLSSATVIEPVVEDIRASNCEKLIAGSDVVLDGTDNFPTRHIINEACCKLGIPWVYGACVGSYGLSYAIIPGQTPCLHCIQDELPAAGDTPTCDTVGIIAPIVHVVTGFQVAEALKIIVGQHDALRSELWSCDVWKNTFQRLNVVTWRNGSCPVCGPKPTYPLLSEGDDAAIILCGRDAVQIRKNKVDLTRLRHTLGARVILENDYLIRWQDGAFTATCFCDGRVVVHGAHDPAAARTFCDRWLG
jgi:molybdopterin/thiamine biosynthesis adenylyltransferase